MKKTLSLYLLLFIGLNQLLAQSNQECNLIIEVENSELDSLQIQGLDMIPRKTIKLDSNGIGSSTLNLKKGVYNLIYGNDREKIYLIPGGTLRITFNANQITESIQFSGEGTVECEYLLDKDIGDNKAVQLRTYLLNENDFLRSCDSLLNSNRNRLAKYHTNLDPELVYWTLGEIKYQYLYDIQNYPSLHRYKSADKDFEVSATYRNVLDELNLSEGKLADVFYYNNLVSKYIHEQAKNDRVENDSTDKFYSYLLKLDELVQSPEVKSQVAYREALYYINRTSVLELYMEKFRELSIDSIQKQYIENIYEKLLLTQKGNPSPSFSFKNKKGKIVSLSDFKGKLVYIDIWATWCVPCIKEIPHIDTLQSDYSKEKIEFISIAYSDEKDKWIEMIKDKKMGGVQLFAEDKNDPFFKDYSLIGIPRFILLDKELNIVNANAKRPSDKSLRQQLDVLLEK